MFGRLSRPAVTRLASASPNGWLARVNLGGAALVRDCRSAARIAVLYRSEPTFARPARGPVERVPG